MKISGDTVYFNDNVFLVKEVPPFDTIMVLNPVTGKQDMMIASNLMPYMINGDPIYTYKDVNTPPTFKDNTVKDFRKQLIKSIEDIFERFKDGDYTLDLGTMVLDRKGKLAFYNVRITANEQQADPAILEEMRKAENKVAKELDGFPAFTPATKDGKNVAYYLTSSFNGPYRFTVDNKKVDFIK